MTIHRLVPASVPGFVRSAPVAVLSVGLGTNTRFETMIADHFAKRHDAVLGTVDILEIGWSSLEVRSWFALQIVALGQWPGALVPGYYLFVDGEVRCYARTDTAEVLASAVIGMIFRSGRAFESASADASRRVIETFEATLIGWASTSERKRRGKERTDGPTAELIRAYKTLGLTPAATLTEVKAARARLAKDFHPDKRAQSKIDEATANALMKRINVAYDIIVAAGRRSA
jgi:hypothetical protein